MDAALVVVLKSLSTAYQDPVAYLNPGLQGPGASEIG